jgi:hypothetical protein
VPAYRPVGGGGGLSDKIGTGSGHPAVCSVRRG